MRRMKMMRLGKASGVFVNTGESTNDYRGALYRDSFEERHGDGWQRLQYGAFMADRMQLSEFSGVDRPASDW